MPENVDQVSISKETRKSYLIYALSVITSRALADHLLAELRQHTVDMRPTYNAETEEPIVVPAQFPNILVNGTAGIAVGMATNMPPHNLGEVLRACIYLVDEPEATTAQLLDK